MPSIKTTETDIQIRFADVDILGHVNNVNIQHYFDLGKNAYMREVIELSSNWQELGIITASIQTSYLAQTRLDESVYVETAIEKIGNKSFVFHQRLLSRTNGELKAENRSIMVAFNFKEQVSVPVPDTWKTAAGFC